MSSATRVWSGQCTTLISDGAPGSCWRCHDAPPSLEDSTTPALPTVTTARPVLVMDWN